MDSQDTLALAEVMEDNKDWEESDNLIYFLALKNYLSHLIHYGGTLKRITKVTSMMNNLVPEVREYLSINVKDCIIPFNKEDNE